MGTWEDIQKGKKPWKPKFSWKSVTMRLGISLPFLAFGFAVLYFYSTCNIRLHRDDSQKVNAVVSKSYLGIPFLWQSMNDVAGVRVDSEMRTVEKKDPYGSSSGKLSLNEVSVSRIVLKGGKNGQQELPVSSFLFYADAENQDAARDLSRFLESGEPEMIERSIPPAGSAVPPFLGMLFLFGLGGFVFLSLFIDVSIWIIQDRYRKKNLAGKNAEKTE